MMTNQQYGAMRLGRDFPTETKFLDFLFDAQHSRDCPCGGTYRSVKGRRQYQCSRCQHQISATIGTVFYKKKTKLTTWLAGFIVVANAHGSISTKELERQLGVPYGTARRMLPVIKKVLDAHRVVLGDGLHKLNPIVFVDQSRAETFRRVKATP